MIKGKHFYVMSNEYELTKGNSKFGSLNVMCEVREYTDVENLSSKTGYQIIVKTRVKIFSACDYQIGLNDQSKFLNYPALLSNALRLTAPDGATTILKSIYPRTLNSSVSTTRTSQVGTGNSTSHENSTGSSNTNINTYGVSASLGFFGDVGTGSIGANYSHSSEDTSSHSFSIGHAQSSNNTIGADDSMTIKDWSSYSKIDSTGVMPTWIWGQSYPWNVINYNIGDKKTGVVMLPDFVTARMVAGSNLSPFPLPPSELSLFGTDFTMQAAWLVLYDGTVPFDDSLSISVATQSFTASHSIGQGGNVQAQLQTGKEANQATNSLNVPSLSALGLNPILSPAVNNGAAIGFSTHPFLVPPATATDQFKILSGANNLQVTGSGFTQVNGLQTDFSQKPQITLTFKIADTDKDYTLVLMHWMQTSEKQCTLEYTVNGKSTGSIVVNAIEGKGAQSNLSTIELRNTNFTSSLFRDFLIVGTNTINISINGTASNNYNLYAVAIES